jgi:uncharacterized protein (TIGR03086 family)
MTAGRVGEREGADWLRLHHVAMAEFDVRVHMIPPDHWEASTPCDEWDVHDLVRHNTVENLWVPPLLGGLSVAEVGDAFDGDVLGSDPESVWEGSRREALVAFDGADLDGEVALARGATPTLEYLQERVFDLLVHAWDLARGIGVDETLDDEVVAAVWEWARPMAPMLAALPQYFEPPVPVDTGADLQTRLLHLTGREV